MDDCLRIRSNLQKKLDDTSKKGWIRSYVRSDKDAIFEIESVIEKISHSYTVITNYKEKNYYKTLFVINPTGPTGNDSSRLRKTYGKSISDVNKSLRLPISCKNKTLFNDSYYFTLICDKKNKKLFIKITDLNGKQIEKKVYWDFDVLESMLYKKIKNIVLIDYERKFIDIDEYFRIKLLKVYDNVSFNKFIKEVEKGNVRVYMKVGIFASGNNIGKTHDHGATFQISDTCYKNLFDLTLIKNTKRERFD